MARSKIPSLRESPPPASLNHVPDRTSQVGITSVLKKLRSHMGHVFFSGTGPQVVALGAQDPNEGL